MLGVFFIFIVELYCSKGFEKRITKRGTFIHLYGSGYICVELGYIKSVFIVFFIHYNISRIYYCSTIVVKYYVR